MYALSLTFVLFYNTIISQSFVLVFDVVVVDRSGYNIRINYGEMLDRVLTKSSVS